MKFGRWCTVPFHSFIHTVAEVILGFYRDVGLNVDIATANDEKGIAPSTAYETLKRFHQ